MTKIYPFYTLHYRGTLIDIFDTYNEAFEFAIVRGWEEAIIGEI